MSNRPRGIAKLKVLLGGDVKVCEWPSFGVKDMYRQIFNQSSKYSDDAAKATEQQKWYFEANNLAMLDNWVILKYGTYPFKGYAAYDNAPVYAQFSNDGLEISSLMSSDSLTIAKKANASDYGISKNQPWAVKFNIAAMDDGFKAVIKSVKASLSTEEKKNVSREEIIKGLKIACNGLNDPIYDKVLLDTKIDSPKVIFRISDYYYVFDRGSSRLFLYKKIVYKEDGETKIKFELLKDVSLFYNVVSGTTTTNDEVSGEDEGNENQKFYHMLVYPLGKKIYIGDNTIDPWKSGNTFIAFSDFVDIPGGNIEVMCYGSSCFFNIERLEHRSSGVFSRPPVGTNNRNSCNLKTTMMGQRTNKTIFSTSSEATKTIEYPERWSNNSIFYGSSKNNAPISFGYLNDKVEYIYGLTRTRGKKGARKWSYGVTLVSKGKDSSERLYSPAICRAELFVEPDIQSVGQKQIDISEYTLSASINLTNEQSSGSVVLTNRSMDTEDNDDAVFTDEYLIWGIRPIEIWGSYVDEDYELLFKGYTNGEPSVSKNADVATITLTCQDVSAKARETFGINLPIYDGWCHLAVIRNLFTEAGYTDDDSEILPTEPISTCYDGHLAGLPNEKYHALMPFHINENPGYMFQMGTPIWECLQQIRQISQWYLYGRYDGKLIYAPYKELFKFYGHTFKEVPDSVGNFDEIRNNLSMSVTFNNAFRNAIYRSGIVTINQNGHLIDTVPFIRIMRQKNWPDNVTDKTYMPWLRWDASHDPSMNNPDSLNKSLIVVAKRVSRERRNHQFSCWGTKLIPYEIIKIEENIKDESFVNKSSTNDSEEYVVTSVSHSFSNGALWDTSIECELYDKDAFILAGDNIPEFIEV